MAKKSRPRRAPLSANPTEAGGTESQAPRGCLWGAIALVVCGCGLAVLSLRDAIVPAIRANQTYVETSCVLLEKQVEHTRRDGTTFHRSQFVQGRRGTIGGTPVFHIKYRIDGRSHSPWVRDDAGAFSTEREKRRFFDAMQVGETYPCWYDPADPSKVVLIRGYGLGFAFMVLLPIVFLGAGLLGLMAVAKGRLNAVVVRTCSAEK